MLTGETILKADDVHKSFGRKQVLNGISLELLRGKFYGLVGENGSGKTTLLNILAGFWNADKGSVMTRCSTGYCPQEPYLFSDLTVDENINLFSLAYNHGYMSDMKHFEEYRRSLFETFNLSGCEKTVCSELSEGSRQKLSLIISLLHDPDLILLDEPYSSFDWDTYLKFWDYSRRLKDRQKTVLIVSHFIYDKSLTDEIWELKNGNFI